MRVPADVRAQLRVAGLPVGGHLPAGVQGVQRGHRDGADHVPHGQLDHVQHVRVGVLRRMVSDQGVGQLPAVHGHGPTERHRHRRGELHPADQRLLSAGGCARAYPPDTTVVPPSTHREPKQTIIARFYNPGESDKYFKCLIYLQETQPNTRFSVVCPY